MKLLMLLFCIATALAASNASEGSEARSAWWLDAKFDTKCPASSAKSVNWQGQCIVLLNSASMAAQPAFDPKSMPLVGAVLSTTFQESWATKELYYAVGVFRTHDGRDGRALVISANPKFDPVDKAIISHDEAGFSALIKKRDRLLWTFCLSCGDFEVVARKRISAKEQK